MTEPHTVSQDSYEEYRTVQQLQEKVYLAKKTLEEAKCWIPDGTLRTAWQRGAHCQTSHEMFAMLDHALATLDT